jgi:hypothetical protein
MFSGTYEGVSKSFRTKPITKYTLRIMNTPYEATRRVMLTKLTRMTHKIAIQLNLMAESCAICISGSNDCLYFNVSLKVLVNMGFPHTKTLDKC